MMRFLIGVATAIAVPTLAVSGDAFDGISKNVDKNGAFDSVTVGTGETFVTKGGQNGGVTGDVIIGDRIRAAASGKAGPKASSKSVVGPLERTGCTGGTRVDLPGGGGSSC